MANRERLEIIISALNEAHGELLELKNDLGVVSKEAEKSGNVFDNLKKHYLNVRTAVTDLGQAVKKSYEFIKEGAELELTATQFKNIATNAGLVSDVLLGKMREATGGLVSDAELMRSGLQIIELGLADSEDGIVRLATAVSTLGLDMQQVIMTFANNSEMRLDALGLSVETVRKRTKELNDEGFDGDAFDQAVLEGLEERMGNLGDTTETTAGQLKIMEASADNLKNELKLLAAQAVGPLIEDINNEVVAWRLVQAAHEQGLISTTQMAAEYFYMSSGARDANVTLENYAAIMARNEIITERVYDISYRYSDQVDATGVAVKKLTAKELAQIRVRNILKATTDDYIDSIESVGMAQDFAARQADDYSEATQGVVSSLRELTAADLARQAIEDLSAAMKADPENYDFYAQKMGVIATTMLGMDQSMVDANLAAAALSAQFEKDQDWDAYITGMSEILDLLNGISGDWGVNVRVKYDYVGGPPSGVGGGVGGGAGGVPDPTMAQHGGMFSVSGRAGVDRVPLSMMLTRGETLAVYPRGTGAAQGAGSVIFNYSPVISTADAQEAADRLVPFIEESMRSR